MWDQNIIKAVVFCLFVFFKNIRKIIFQLSLIDTVTSHDADCLANPNNVTQQRYPNVLKYWDT